MMAALIWGCEKAPQPKAQVADPPAPASVSASVAKPGGSGAYSFQDLELGVTTKSEYEKRVGRTLPPLPDETWIAMETDRNPKTTVAGAPVKSIAVMFLDDRLMQIQAVFDIEHDAQVVRALTEKWGEPKRSENWDNGVSRIWVRLNSNNDSEVMYMHKGLGDEMLNRSPNLNKK